MDAETSTTDSIGSASLPVPTGQPGLPLRTGVGDLRAGGTEIGGATVFVDNIYFY